MKMLRAALYQRKLEKQEAEKAKLEATKTDNSWGNQIRSLRLPAVHDGQRPPHRAQDPRRAEGDGRRPRRVHRGVPEAVRRARRRERAAPSERLRRSGAAREARRARGAGIAPYAYRFDRTHTAADALAALRRRRWATTVPRSTVAGRLVAFRVAGQDGVRAPRGRPAASSSTSGRTSSATAFDAARAARPRTTTSASRARSSARARARSPCGSTAVELLAKSLRPLPCGKAQRRTTGRR